MSRAIVLPRRHWNHRRTVSNPARPLIGALRSRSVTGPMPGRKMKLEVSISGIVAVISYRRQVTVRKITKNAVMERVDHRSHDCAGEANSYYRGWGSAGGRTQKDKDG